jgi:hypothetical protein
MYRCCRGGNILCQSNRNNLLLPYLGPLMAHNYIEPAALLFFPPSAFHLAGAF